MYHKLIRAQEQRLIALRNAFATIDAFAIPSLSPDEFDKYEAVKKSLLDNYGKIDEPQNETPCTPNLN